MAHTQYSFWRLPPTHCDICGKLLTVDASIQRGIGPVCFGKHGKDKDMAFKDKDFEDFTILEPIDACILLRRDEQGVVWTNIPHLVVHHSPNGYEFGYGGSGPADLALNIVEIILNRLGYEGKRVKCYRGDCWDMAWKLHQDFKFAFIGGVPREGGISPTLWLRTG